eukprot:4633845-Heterocapsa_arctica.AAC.1
MLSFGETAPAPVDSETARPRPSPQGRRGAVAFSPKQTELHEARSGWDYERTPSGVVLVRPRQLQGG